MSVWLMEGSGEVRDIFESMDRVVLVAGDGVSELNHKYPIEIPGKGKILTRLSAFWFNKLVGVN